MRGREPVAVKDRLATGTIDFSCPAEFAARFPADVDAQWFAETTASAAEERASPVVDQRAEGSVEDAELAIGNGYHVHFDVFDDFRWSSGVSGPVADDAVAEFGVAEKRRRAAEEVEGSTNASLLVGRRTSELSDGDQSDGVVVRRRSPSAAAPKSDRKRR